MDDALEATTSAAAASDPDPAVDRDAIVAFHGSSRVNPRRDRKRRRRLTAAERFSRWMDDTDACFRAERAARSGDCRAARVLDGCGIFGSSSIPTLLAHREAFGGLGGLAEGWQRHVLAVAKPSPPPKRSQEGTMNAPNSYTAGMLSGAAQPMRYEFRSWHRRTVPFTRLGTPKTEAVLGLDRTGSYSITLGDLDVPGADYDHGQDDGGANGRSNSRACLALRMYGLPSPSALRLGRNRSEAAQRKVASPLLITVPLHTAPHSEFHSLTARTPTVLCLSSDGEMGVAFVRDPVPLFQRMETSDLQPVVALVIFPLPRHYSMTTTPDLCPGVSIIRRKDPQTSVSDRATDMKKVLWKVHRLPGLATGSNNCDSAGGDATEVDAVGDARGYLLLLRQENRCCFRLTWIQSAHFRQAARAQCLSLPRSPNRSDGVSINGSTAILTSMLVGTDGCWERSCSDRLTGIEVPRCSRRCHPLTSSGGDGIRVVGERWLRLDAVLEDIVKRRPKFGPPPPISDDSSSGDNPATLRVPVHSVDIVQVSHGGEALQAVICFMPCHNKRTMYAVFVEVDLLAQIQSYREVTWLRRSLSLATDHASPTRDEAEVVLARMAEILSLNQRMSLERIGPYSVDPEPLRDWSALCRCEGTVEPEEWTVRDPDPIRWRMKQSGQVDSDTIPMSDAIPFDAIYPDCHVLDNLAVLRQTPVRSLKSRSSATEIVYG